MLGIAIGNWREAAHQCSLSEGRVLNWVVRYGWKLPKRIEAPHPREVLSLVVGVVTPAQSLQERLKHDAEATRVGLSTATRKASVSLAERDGDDVVSSPRSFSHSGQLDWQEFRQPVQLVLGLHNFSQGNHPARFGLRIWERQVSLRPSSCTCQRLSRSPLGSRTATPDVTLAPVFAIEAPTSTPTATATARSRIKHRSRRQSTRKADPREPVGKFFRSLFPEGQLNSLCRPRSVDTNCES